MKMKHIKTVRRGSNNYLVTLEIKLWWFLKPIVTYAIYHKKRHHVEHAVFGLNDEKSDELKKWIVQQVNLYNKKRSTKKVKK